MSKSDEMRCIIKTTKNSELCSFFETIFQTKGMVLDKDTGVYFESKIDGSIGIITWLRDHLLAQDKFNAQDIGAITMTTLYENDTHPFVNEIEFFETKTNRFDYFVDAYRAFTVKDWLPWHELHQSYVKWQRVQ